MTYLIFIPIFGLLGALTLAQAVAIKKLQQRVDDVEAKLAKNPHE